MRLLFMAVLVAACGARSSLDGADGGTDAAVDAAHEVGPSCSPADMTTWRTERFRDQGDYERAAVAVSNAAWVALKPKGGDVILVELGVDAQQGIVFRHRIEIDGAAVYPVALDVDDRRFMLLTTSEINWNGDVELWRIDRNDGTVLHASVGKPSNPAYTIYSALGIAGEDVVFGYARAAENQGTVEIRDDALQILQSIPVSDVSFTAVHAGADAVDLYLGADACLHVQNGVATPQPVDPSWQVIGGQGDVRVEIGSQVRLREGQQTWSAAWPHTQISPPAVARTDGSRAAFSLETELTGVVGFQKAPGALEWLRIEPTIEASGLGAVLLPVIESGRLGVFYLGLEIPRPEQPLRYYGLACP